MEMDKNSLVNDIIVKMDVILPYGGSFDKSIMLSLPVVKLNGTDTIFTVNRSPHGNKTAREQFKMSNIKYTGVVKLDSMLNVESLVSYLGIISGKQGINNTYVKPSVSYIIDYKIFSK